MISFAYSLSPVLAALLLKEFEPTFISELGIDKVIDAERDRTAIACFLSGLEEHRLVLRCDCVEYCFFDAILVYLDALLDPAPTPFGSGIEHTASGATDTWDNMTSEAREKLTLEAQKLHPIIAALLNARPPKR